LGLKEPFDYYFNEMAVEAARREASGLTRNNNSKRESWITALSLTEQGQRLPTRGNTAIKKEVLTLSPGNVAEGS
jgi:hypothetical protein